MFLPCRVPHNVSARDTVLGSAYSNLECYLMRLRITLNRSIRQQEDILNPGFPHLHADQSHGERRRSLLRNCGTCP